MEDQSIMEPIATCIEDLQFIASLQGTAEEMDCHQERTESLTRITTQIDGSWDDVCLMDGPDSAQFLI